MLRCTKFSKLFIIRPKHACDGSSWSAALRRVWTRLIVDPNLMRLESTAFWRYPKRLAD
jgi:hypothetical protein